MGVPSSNKIETFIAMSVVKMTDLVYVFNALNNKSIALHSTSSHKCPTMEFSWQPRPEVDTRITA